MLNIYVMLYVHGNYSMGTMEKKTEGYFWAYSSLDQISVHFSIKFRKHSKVLEI